MSLTHNLFHEASVASPRPHSGVSVLPYYTPQPLHTLPLVLPAGPPSLASRASPAACVLAGAWMVSIHLFVAGVTSFTHSHSSMSVLPYTPHSLHTMPLVVSPAGPPSLASRASPAACVLAGAWMASFHLGVADFTSPTPQSVLVGHQASALVVWSLPSPCSFHTHLACRCSVLRCKGV